MVKAGIPYLPSLELLLIRRGVEHSAEKFVNDAKTLEAAGAALLDFTHSGPVAGPAVVNAVSIPVVGGMGGGPWLDGRMRMAHAAIGYAASSLESTDSTLCERRTNHSRRTHGLFGRRSRFTSDQIVMGTTIIDGITTRYEVVGSGPPLLMFSPAGFDATLEKWTTQSVYATTKMLDHLSRNHSCIIYDRREAGPVRRTRGARNVGCTTSLRARDC